MDAALKKGDLKFTLDGFKLKGSWVLVRTGGRYPGGRRDAILAAHQAQGRVVRRRGHHEFAPKSVKSDGDFADIWPRDPDVWRSNGGAPGQGGRDRRDVREDHRARRASRPGAAEVAPTAGPKAAVKPTETARQSGTAAAKSAAKPATGPAKNRSRAGATPTAAKRKTARKRTTRR